MKKITIFLAFLAVSFFTQAQKITDGTWYNAEKDGKVSFYMEGNKLYGKIVWLERPTENGKAKLDVNNPKANLKTKPLMGLVFLKDFEKEDEKTWEDGTIYDPKSGKTYSSTINIVNANQLDVRGYIGFSLLGRTTTFTRASN
jgi:uncharacterized protein (DUF2147 family)